MKQIILTNEAEQSITEYLDNGESIAFTFNYRDNALGWFVDFTYNNITRRGIKLVAGTNILRPFTNLIPIDLYVKVGTVLEEPYLVESFNVGLAELYIVTPEERDGIIDGTLEF